MRMPGRHTTTAGAAGCYIFSIDDFICESSSDDVSLAFGRRNRCAIGRLMPTFIYYMMGLFLPMRWLNSRSIGLLDAPAAERYLRY